MNIDAIDRTTVLRIADRLEAHAEELRRIMATPIGEGYCAPIGTEEERASGEIWPGHWVVALGHLKYYQYGWHEAVDLNLNHPHWDADRHRPVYSITYGEVYAVRTGVSGWDTVVCIRHDECLTRYAHVENIQMSEGQRVLKGEHIANIGNAGGRYPYHLHFSIARLEARMAKYPLDWPGKARDARERVIRDYYDPEKFLRERAR